MGLFTLGKLFYQLKIILGPEHSQEQIPPNQDLVQRTTLARDFYHAYSFAEEHFKGWRYVTTEGYLLPAKERMDDNNFYERIPREAILNLEQNIAPLNYLRGVMKKEISSIDAKSDDRPLSIVTFEYSYPTLIMGNLELVKAEGSRLYLPLVREGISDTVNHHIRDLCSKTLEAARQVKPTEKKHEPEEQSPALSGPLPGDFDE